MLIKTLGCYLVYNLGGHIVCALPPSYLQDVDKVKLWPHLTVTVGKWLCIFYFSLTQCESKVNTTTSVEL